MWMPEPKVSQQNISLSITLHLQASIFSMVHPGAIFFQVSNIHTDIDNVKESGILQTMSPPFNNSDA